MNPELETVNKEGKITCEGFLSHATRGGSSPHTLVGHPLVVLVIKDEVCTTPLGKVTTRAFTKFSSALDESTTFFVIT